jgi:TatD DNase family protein
MKMTSSAASLFDTHAHLDDGRFSDDVDAVLHRARKAGVERILTVASRGSVEGLRAPVELARTSEMVWAAVGVHPHEASSVTPELLEEASRLAASEPRVVAIGEIGLDYHYDFSPREIQRARFEDLLRLSRELDLPVVVHIREAHEDGLRILRKASGGRRWRGVIHCFSGDEDEAREYLELGFHISFTGVLTFKKAESARRVARSVARDRTMIETDAPYLAPVPHRGKRCEPAHVRQTAEKLAEIWGADLAEVAMQTTRNALDLFGIPA